MMHSTRAAKRAGHGKVRTSVHTKAAPLVTSALGFSVALVTHSQMRRALRHWRCSDFSMLGFSVKVIMMKTLIGLVMLLSIGLLIGCNTIDGAGQDIERGGEAVSDTAKEVQKSM
jgi:entericidin B